MVTTGVPPAAAGAGGTAPPSAAGIGAGRIDCAASGDDSPVGCAASAAVSNASRDMGRAGARPLLRTSLRFAT